MILNRITIYSPLLMLFIILFSCKSNDISYLDKELPMRTPKLFAPNLVNTDKIELNVVFNNAHTEMFFTRIVNNSFIIHHSELINGKWSKVKPISMYESDVLVSVACDPTITKDGKTMYFLGVDPNHYKNDITPEKLYKIPPDIYKSKKVNGEWQKATKVSFSVSTKYLETYPVVTDDGSLYFKSNRPSESGGMHTYRAQYLGNDKFETPKLIEFKTKQNELITYVFANEKIAITNGQGKFQVTHNKDGEWTTPKEVPLKYEPNWRYYAPYMSSDGKYFIFSRRQNIPNKKGWAGVKKGEVFWVDSDILFDSEAP